MPHLHAFPRKSAASAPLFLALLTAIAIVFAILPAWGQTPSGGGTSTERAGAEKLEVLTKPAPPFAMKRDDGTWSGLAIDLFEAIARELGREVVWRDMETTAEMIDALAKGNGDVGIAAVTINADREEVVDFTHSYYDSGLAIAVARNPGASIFDVFKALASPAFLTTVGTLATLLLATGALIWFAERGKNSDQFQDDPVKGIGNGFWWSAVTMTTVGYGDKAPVTLLGRGIAVVWMFAALILTAVFTAQLASSLTIGSISGPVKGPSDLNRARVGVVEKAASSTYFNERFLRPTGFKDVETGLNALMSGEIDAFVHDEPILRFRISRDFARSVELLPQIFQPQDYGIVLPPDSMMREEINRALLAIKTSEEWGGIRRRYFGEESQ